jgi:hypothetical protein
MPQFQSDETRTTMTYDNDELPDWYHELDLPARSALLAAASELALEIVHIAPTMRWSEVIRRAIGQGFEQVGQSMLTTQHQLNTTVTAVDGPLAKANSVLMAPAMTKLDTHVTENTTALRALQTQVAALETRVEGQRGEQRIIDKSTWSGKPFERNDVYERCLAWATPLGGIVAHVGPDQETGDVLVTFPAHGVLGFVRDFSIVYEAKNRTKPFGRKPITDILTAAMAVYKADAGIYVTKTPEGLAQHTHRFMFDTCPGGQPYVATVIDGIELAGQFLIERHRAAQAVQAGTDPATLDAWVSHLRFTLHLNTNILKGIADQRTALDKQEGSVKSQGNIIHDIIGAIVNLRPTLATITIS